MKRYKTVDAYVESLDKFRPEIERLREVLGKTKLVEEVKWGMPTYTYAGKNVVGLAAFKEHFGLWFHQGALLSDPDKVLVNAQEGRTKAMRHWRMQTKKDIKVRPIQAYVKEAIGHVEAGASIKPDKNRAIDVPPELEAALKKSAPLRKAFEALSPGKRRDYAQHIGDAKRDETKAKRLEKILPMIRAGVGLHDKYRNC